MKKYLFIPFALFSLNIFGQGFSTTPFSWTCPNGGNIAGGITNGFNGGGSNASATDNAGSQSWTTADMNGDGYRDLVITAEQQGGNVTTFSPASGQYWKVFLSNGSGFSPTSINWTCPDGGKIKGGITYGFNFFFGTAVSTDNAGSQTWYLYDINGDAKPDLIIFAELQGGVVTSFSPASSQYWKVYLNTGTGFSTTAINWACPNGGNSVGGVIKGFNASGGTASVSDDAGSQTWTIMDVNGDAKSDLVVTAELQGGNVTSFSPTSSQYWKAYLNTGSGFSTTDVNWICPDGGKIKSGTTLGYNAYSALASLSDDNGSQSWGMRDMNGDGKSDLIVTGQLQTGNLTSFSPTSGQYWKVYINSGSSFYTSAINWILPNGGDITSGITNGFNSLGGTAATTDNAFSQSWVVADLNGDNKADLIVTGELEGADVTSFSPTSGQYWQVSLNNGAGYNPVVNWTCPNGGDIAGGVTRGFNTFFGIAYTTENTGSQTWAVYDMNGDGNQDLIVSAELQGGNVTSFSPTASQYWKVYYGSVATTTAEYLSQEELTFYPNPSNDLLHIGSEKYIENATIELYDVTGQLIFKKQLSKFNNEVVNISGFENGIYLIHVVGNEGKLNATKRIVKQ